MSQIGKVNYIMQKSHVWWVSGGKLRNHPLRFTQTYDLHFVMWMQQGRIYILGKIEFFIDNENAGKNAQVKLYFMPELKVILNLWKK